MNNIGSSHLIIPNNLGVPPGLKCGNSGCNHFCYLISFMLTCEDVVAQTLKRYIIRSDDTGASSVPMSETSPGMA